MLYSCALIFFLCSSGCLLTISLFSDRWLLVEVALKETDKIRVTTYVTVGLWETRRVRYYRYYHHYHPYWHHHHHAFVIYQSEPHHKPAAQPPAQQAAKPPAAQPSTPTPTPATESNKSNSAAGGIALPSAAGRAGFASARLTEKKLYHLSDSNNGALIAIRVLLFLCIGLAFGGLFLLLVTACNDTNVIRHRYKERKLAFTLAGMCAMALLLTIVSWSVFLGTMYHSVQQYGNSAANSLNAGFVCSILATVCLIVSIILSACTVDEE